MVYNVESLPQIEENGLYQLTLDWLSRFLMWFHKYELSLFSAIEFEKKSLLEVWIKEFVLFRQNLYWFHFFSFWLISRCLLAALMSSLSLSGWFSFLTLLVFRGAWLLRTFIITFVRLSQLRLESISDMINKFSEIESWFKNAGLHFMCILWTSVVSEWSLALSLFYFTV